MVDPRAKAIKQQVINNFNIFAVLWRIIEIVEFLYKNSVIKITVYVLCLKKAYLISRAVIFW